MAGTLAIAGTDYPTDVQDAGGLAVDSLCLWDLDADSALEFHEYCAGASPRFAGGMVVEYRDSDAVLRFRGEIASAQPGWNEGRTWGYRCFGMKTVMDRIPVRAPDFSGSLVFNAPPTDPDWSPDRSGMSVGDLIAAVLALHADALAAVGIGTDQTTPDQLAALTLVPDRAVRVEGGRLASAIEAVLRGYARNSRLLVLPSGLLRFPDVTAPNGTPATLTLGVDPVQPPLLARDWSDRATRIVCYGAGRVLPFNGRMAADPPELVPEFTEARRLAWKDSDFTAPGDASDSGTVATTAGPTSIEVASSDPARTWPVNFWAGRNAWVQLRKTTGIGLEYQAGAPVTACDALAAGGTATLTLGIPLDRSDADSWDSYALVGTTGPLAGDDSGTSPSDVYRLYRISTPGGLVEAHPAASSPVPLPFYGLNDASVQLVTTPVALLVGGGATVPASFRVLPDSGRILFDEPIVRAFNSPEALATGGDAVVPPDDVLFMVPYVRGPLQLAHPPDDPATGAPVFAGGAFDSIGLERTAFVHLPSWRYEGNSPLVADLAAMLHEAASAAIVEGDVRCDDPMPAFHDPGDGFLLSFASTCGTTGDEALNVPIRAVTLAWDHSGSGPPVSAVLRVSSRREQGAGGDFYLHPSQPGRNPARGAFRATRVGTRELKPDEAAPFDPDRTPRAIAERKAAEAAASGDDSGNPGGGRDGTGNPDFGGVGNLENPGGPGPGAALPSYEENVVNAAGAHAADPGDPGRYVPGRSAAARKADVANRNSAAAQARTEAARKRRDRIELRRAANAAAPNTGGAGRRKHVDAARARMGRRGASGRTTASRNAPPGPGPDPAEIDYSEADERAAIGGDGEDES